MKRRWILFFVLCALALYGKSLRYEFVYDDHWRIENNLAIRTLANPGRFFTDRTTQSSSPALHRDSHRPLTILSFAFDYAVWRLRAGGYRLTNIVLHGINSYLVAQVAIQLFGLSLLGAIFAGLLFLVHPINIESVAWIVERTNVLGFFFAWMGILAAIRFLDRGKERWAWLMHASLVASLLSREIAVVLPVLFLLIGFYWKTRTQRCWPSTIYVHGALLVGEVIAFLAFRSHVIGQIKISEMWGGTWSLNMANVVAIWPLYLRSLVFPHPLCVTYGWLPVAERWLSLRVVLGVGFLVATMSAAIFYARKDARITVCLIAVGLFWLPGSNMIPLTTLFGERLLYPVVPWAATIVAFALEMRGTARSAVAFALVVLLASVTWLELPTWQNDYTLWRHAVHVRPQSWFAWACLGDQQRRRLEYVEAKESFERALHFQVPVDSAGAIFFQLAETHLDLNDRKSADVMAARALLLRPDLRDNWQNALRRRHLVTSSTSHDRA